MVLVVIILVGAFLVIRSAIVGQIRSNIKDADFEQDVLQAQAGCTAPTLSNIQIQNISTTGANVLWTTNQQSTSVVKLGVTSGGMNWLTEINSPASTLGVLSHSYNLVGLLPAKKYYYRVKSSNGTCQKTSSTYSFTTLGSTTGTADVTAPSLVSNFTATNITGTSATLSWNSAIDPIVSGAVTSGIKNYEVYGPTGACNVNGSAGFCGNVIQTSATTYSLPINGLVSGTTYSGSVGATAGFTVIAYDNANNHSAGTARLSFTAGTGTTTDNISPTTPTNLTSPSKTANSVSLAWTASTDNSGAVAGYKIYVNGSTTPNNSTLNTSTSYTVSGLSASTAYTFTVRAQDGTGNVSTLTPSLSVTTNGLGDVSAPTKPTGLTSSNITSTGFILSWSPSTDDTLSQSQIHYDVYGPTGACNVIAIAGYCGAVTGVTSMVISGLASNTTYNTASGANAGFIVQAYDNSLHYSIGSNVFAITTLPGIDNTSPIISNVSISATTTNATATWTTNEPATSVVEYGQTTSYGQSVTNTTLSINHLGLLSPLTSGTTYHYRVKSTDGSGNLAVSPDASFVAMAGPVACGNTPLTGYEKAMWVWKNNSSVITAGSVEQNNLFTFVDAQKIQRIYLYANNSNLSDSSFVSNLKVFLNTAWNSHCLKVEVLDGAPNWIVTDNTYIGGPINASAHNWVASALSINSSITGSNVKIAGIHMDVEPHGFVSGDYPGYTLYWSNDKLNVSKAYIKMLQAVKDQASGLGTPIAVDVTRWFDSDLGLVSINYGGVTKNLMQHVFDRVDELGIMDYTTNASSIYSDALGEMNYGLTLGKKVTIGVETIDLTSYGGGNSVTSFWPTLVNNTNLATQCTSLGSSLNNTYSLMTVSNKQAFNRFAVHAYWNDKNGVMSGYKYLCQ